MCDRQLKVGVEAVLNEAIKPSAAAGGYPCAGRDYHWTGRRGSRDPFRSTPTPRGGLALEENVLHAHNPPNEDLPRRKYVACDPTPRRSFALDGQTMWSSCAHGGQHLDPWRLECGLLEVKIWTPQGWKLDPWKLESGPWSSESGPLDPRARNLDPWRFESGPLEVEFGDWARVG